MRARSDASTPEPVVGLDEILLGLGLVLMVVGLWVLVGAAALVVPGAVLLYIALPSRAPFVLRPPESDADMRRKR